MPHEEAFANTKVPHATAEGIWNKAAMLIREENATVVAPGCGPKDKMIKSKSGMHHIWLQPQIMSTNVTISVHSLNPLPYVLKLLLHLSPIVK